MFRSIFNRLMITYILLVILLTGCLAIFMSIAFNRYVFTEKHNILSAAAIKVESLIKSYNDQKLSNNELQVAIDNLGFMSDSTIYVVKVNKSTLNNPASISLANQLSEAYLLNDLKTILDGKSVYRKKQFSEILDADVVFLGKPLYQDHKIIGAVLIFSPLSPISSYLAKINAMILGAALLVLLISFFFISFTSARISRPIKQMEEITRKIANGEASPELSIHTGDEIEQLADSFNHMKRQVESTELMRREFIANVSHELRTPLTSINGFVQGMQDGLIQSPDYPRYLTIIQEETQRLIRLTGEILDLAKIQGGQLHLQKQPLAVAEQLDKALKAFGLRCLQKNITININCEADLQVWADPDRLQQILNNIIENALRYSEDGQPININVQKQDRSLQFSITDFGAGIQPEDLPYIFERFYRDDKSRFGKTGSGLGLSIVKNLLELHGGKIQVKSQAGQGTSFIFDLPEAYNMND